MLPDTCSAFASRPCGIRFSSRSSISISPNYGIELTSCALMPQLCHEIMFNSFLMLPYRHSPKGQPGLFITRGAWAGGISDRPVETYQPTTRRRRHETRRVVHANNGVEYVQHGEVFRPAHHAQRHGYSPPC